MTEPHAAGSPGLRRQMEIDKAGIAGITPAQPVSPEELERNAEQTLKQAGQRNDPSEKHSRKGLDPL